MHANANVCQDDGSSKDGDTGPALLRIKNYELSKNVYERQIIPIALRELFTEAPPDVLTEDLPQIMKIVARVSREDESAVRTNLLEHIPEIALSAVRNKSRVPILDAVISEHLLPILVHNLADKNNPVRRTALNSFFFLLDKNLLTRQQVEIQVCPTVLGLLNSDMGYHTEPLTLMSRLVRFLGREVTERVFLQRFSQLCASNMFSVRKMCASHFGDLCAVIGKEAYDNILLPSYLNLCGDGVWGVRKSCAEVIISVSSACSPEKRRNALAPVFVKLLQDENRWVRLSAFESLGPFISTFADPNSTRLAYNNFGELVLINVDGSEFKITPQQYVLVDEEDLSILTPTQIMDSILGFTSPIEGEDENTINAETSKEADVPESSNVATVTDSTTETLTDENVITEMQESIDDIFNHPIFDNLLEGVRETLKILEHDQQKPALVSNATKDEGPALCDKPICTNKVINGDASNNDVSATPSSNTESIRDDAKVGNESSTYISNSNNTCENIEDYNSYNYWYVSPNMPLDPKIVNDEAVSSEIVTNNCVPNKQFDKEYFYQSILGMSPTKLSTTSQQLDKPTDNVPTISENQENTSSNFDDSTTKSEYLQQAIVPQVLIDHFVSMTDGNLAQESNNEMAYHCAYFLPAVALTLGSDNWHLLKNTIKVLAANMQYRVRRTVASSLYELAVILGPDIATNSLMPIFEGFIKDLDEVRIGVLKHLAHFLRLISPAIRNFYLPKLVGFLQTDNETNWRFRQELAEQLLLAVPLFSPKDACKHISFLAQELLCDKVAAVREVALLLVTELIRHVSCDEVRTSHLLVKLDEKFAHSKRWKLRQLFALLCSKLLTSCALPPEQFANEVMPHFLDLSWDPVPNVRLVVARTIAQHIITNEYFSDVINAHYDGLQTVLRRLQSDKDRDVRECAVFNLSSDTK